MTTAPPKKKRPTFTSVFGAIGTGLMAGLLALIVLIGIAAIVVPAATASTALTVMTSSMEPDLPPGTLVVVRPTSAEDIAPGDIVTYQLESGKPTLVTHRVTEQRLTADGEFIFVTQGDANPGPDPGFIREIQIRGTVWYALPYVGWVSQIVTGDVRALAIPLIAGALGIYAIWMFVAGIREKRRKNTPSESAEPEQPESERPAPSVVPPTLPSAHADAPLAQLTRRELRAAQERSNSAEVG